MSFAAVLLAMLPDLGGACVQDEPDMPLQKQVEAEPELVDGPAWERETLSWLDMSSMELSFRAGMAMFSEDFEADPEMAYGLFLRAPSPWVSQGIFGFEESDIGFWLEGVTSKIERDENLNLVESEDRIFFLGAGVDYEVVWDRHDGWSWYLRAMAGAQYGIFGDVDDLYDGVAATAGLLLGLEVVGVVITVTPQIALADAGDWIGFGHAGLGLRF